MQIPFGLFCAINRVMTKLTGYQIVSKKFVSDMQVIVVQKILADIKREEVEKSWREQIREEWMERCYEEYKEKECD